MRTPDIPTSSQPARKPIVPAAARRRTGERRTNSQRKSQVTARPREAHVGKPTMGKDKIGGAGGESREGWQPQVEFCHPSLVRARSCFSTTSTANPWIRGAKPATDLVSGVGRYSSFSGARKKRQHERPYTKGKASNTTAIPCRHDRAAMVRSLAAGRAVSRIRGILERRMLLGASARGSPTARALPWTREGPQALSTPFFPLLSWPTFQRQFSLPPG